MRLALRDVPPDQAHRIRARVWHVLAASRWRKRSSWPGAVIVQTPDAPLHVVARAELASDLHAAGLARAAHEATARRVGPGEILLYVVEDNEKRAGVEFVVLDLLGGAR